MQKITIIGNVGQDPVVKVAQTGSQYIEFSVAVYVSKEGTQWYNVRVFGETRNKYVYDYVYKGGKVYVEGTPNYYVSNAATAPSVGIAIMCDKVESLSGPKEQNQVAQPTQPQAQFPQPTNQPYKTTYLGQNIQGVYNVQPQQPTQPQAQFPQPNQMVINPQGQLVQQPTQQQYVQPQTNQVAQNQQPILPNNQQRF